MIRYGQKDELFRLGSAPDLTSDCVPLDVKETSSSLLKKPPEAEIRVRVRLQSQHKSSRISAGSSSRGNGYPCKDSSSAACYLPGGTFMGNSR